MLQDLDRPENSLPVYQGKQKTFPEFWVELQPISHTYQNHNNLYRYLETMQIYVRVQGTCMSLS